MNRFFNYWSGKLIILTATILSLSLPLQAQNYYVIASSPHADSSEYFYAEGATMYMKVFSQNVDVQHMKKMKWEIEPEMDNGNMHDQMDMHFEGNFTNNFDGSFTASFDLSALIMAGQWKWKAKLVDNNKNEVHYQAKFYYKSQPDDSVHQYIELKGYISQISGDTVWVNGYAFTVDANTKIYRHDQGMLPFSELKVNDFVEIEGYGLTNNLYKATKIKLEDHDQDEDENKLEFNGFISSINDSLIEINGMIFRVTAQTIIMGQHQMYLSLSELQSGMFVEIKAQWVNNEYLALKIKVENKDQDEDNYFVELKGFIDSLTANYLVIGRQKVYFDSLTVIKLSHQQFGHITDLQVGQLVEIKAQLNNDGTFYAFKIEIEDDYENEYKITLYGPIDSLGTDFLMISNKIVYVDSNTKILSPRSGQIHFTDLVKGQIVKIKAMVQENGTLLALMVKVKEIWNAHFEITGPIEKIDDQSLQVEGISFKVDSTTQIWSEMHMPLHLSDLQPGTVVEIKAKRLADGSYLALIIKVEDQNNSHLSITGEIQAISTDSIRVNNLNFYVNSTTLIYNLQDSLISLGDLEVGLWVEVKAFIQSDGSYKAKRIEVEYDPNMSSINSTLGGITESSVIILNQEYKVTQTTIILNKDFTPISFTDLVPGETVTVWTTDNTVVQIQSGTTSSVTALPETTNTVVKSFSLKQNYPNPFNPTTTIEFNLNQKGFAQVSLTIYNILGKKVKTLFHGVLNQGTYQFEWNGTNEANQPVASGFYFYRLQVQNKASVKQMILMK